MASEYKLSYTASEIDAKLGKIDSLAAKDEIPSKTSELTNDSGFLTLASVPDELINIYVAHNDGADFSCEKTYGYVQETILDGMPIVGVFVNSATGVTEQIYAELHDDDGEIWFYGANCAYIFYADESWEYDANYAFATKKYVDDNVDQEQIAAAVESYMEEHPVEGGGLTTEIVTAIGEMFEVALYDSDSDYSAAFANFKAATGYRSLYKITNALTCVNTSNEATSVYENEAFETTLTPYDNYKIYTVSVTMNGDDITADCYADGVISIASVSGNIEITALGVIASLSDTTVVLETVNTGGLNRLGSTVTNDVVANVSVSKAYEIGENGAAMQGVIFAGADTSVTTALQSKMRVCVYDSSGAVIGYSSETTAAINNTGTEGTVGFVGTTTGATHVRFSIFTDYADDSYMYFTNTGNVIFAGVNTPYYGMANIDGTYA